MARVAKWAAAISCAWLLSGCAGSEDAGGASGSAGVGAVGSGGTSGSSSGGGGGDGGSVIVPGGSGGTDPVAVVSSLELERVWYVPSQSTDSMVDFNQDPPKVTCGAPVAQSDGFEGAGVFTNPGTGELYFYADGRSVFHGGTHQKLDNGDGLIGNPSAGEAALIAPKLDSGNQQFYIFTTSAEQQTPGQVSYSIMDLGAGANGAILAKNQPLANGNVGEALDLLPHADGQSFWVLTYGSASTVQAFLVGPSGVNTTPIISQTGLTGPVGYGAINHTLDYGTLVLAMEREKDAANGVVAVASFDRHTGMLSNVQQVASGDIGYNACFSPDGTKLYFVTGHAGARGIAHQYDRTTGIEMPLGGTDLGAAKLAPNGVVYFAGIFAKHLAAVQNPNAAGAAAGFVAEGLGLEGCESGFGLPNQTASYLDYLPAAPR